MARLSPYHWFIVSLAVMAALVVLPTTQARVAEVTTMDGRKFVGRVLQDNKINVVLELSGIKIPIPRSEIKHIVYQESIEQRYAQRLDLLEDNDADGRYALAYWLYEKDALKLAKKELDALVESFPKDSRVAQLGRIVEARIKLVKRPSQTSPPPTAPQIPGLPAAGSTRLSPSPTGRQATLTPEDINRIKVYEIDLATKPKVIVPLDVRQSVLNDYPDHPGAPKDARERAQFRNATGAEQLKVLFKLRARHLYGKVRVVDDPPVVEQFRDKIHRRYVLNYCGATACHGGLGTSDFQLIRPRPNTESTVYTNFFKLQAAKVGNEGLIDRQRPGRSLLLQYGLAREKASSPHPDTPGWRAKFQDRNDSLYQTIEQWIDSLWKPDPDYGIQYPLTKPASAETQPGSAP